MTAQNDANEAKSKIKIKATTGAWWKSKVEDGEKASDESVKKPAPRRSRKKPEGKSVKEPEAETGAVVAKSPKKPVAKAKDSPESAGSAAELAVTLAAEAKPVRKRTSRPRKRPEKKVEVVNEDVESSVGSEAATPKKQASRPSRRRSQSVAAQSENQEKTPVIEAVAEQAVVVEAEAAPKKRPARRRSRSRKPAAAPEAPQAANDSEVAEVTAGVEAVDGAEEVAKKRPSRRRSRSRKPAAAPQAEQDANVEAEVEQSATADESEVEASDVVAKKRPNRRRRSRKKRPQEEENSESVEVAEVVEPEVAESADEIDDDFEGIIPEKPKNVRLLINAEEPEECRLALLEDGRLESIHVSTVTRAQTKNNIYKAKVVAIEPNLQAAFVDYGTPKNGFLPFSEIHPEYYRSEVSAATRKNIDERRWKRLKIEDVMERGQEVLVQVVKEEVGKKGANMTTYLSLPGRCVVLMPGSDSAGISRKISGEERRGQLRKTMLSMDIPEGIGWIVRTASVDITEAALSRDVTYLLKLWEDVRSRGQEIGDVGKVYEDHRSVMRFLREHYDPSIQEILVDAQPALEQVNEFVTMLPASQQGVKVRLHKGSRPIFNQFSVEDQIESIYQPQVNLPSGGSIVIDPTEALVAIDVNSGSTSKGRNFDESIFQANMEAASELARQLRLRDLGGLVVVDFIDMRNKKHIRDVERQVKIAMKRDKAKVDFTRISKFGLMQISRQKLGSPLEAGAYRVCEHCRGRGIVRAVETLALFYMRRIQTGASRKPVVKIETHFPLDVASYLLNNKRQEIIDMENRYEVEINIVAESTYKPSENEIIFHREEKEQKE